MTTEDFRDGVWQHCRSGDFRKLAPWQSVHLQAEQKSTGELSQTQATNQLSQTRTTSQMSQTRTTSQMSQTRTTSQMLYGLALQAGWYRLKLHVTTTSQLSQTRTTSQLPQTRTTSTSQLLYRLALYTSQLLKTRTTRHHYKSVVTELQVRRLRLELQVSCHRLLGLNILNKK